MYADAILRYGSFGEQILRESGFFRSAAVLIYTGEKMKKIVIIGANDFQRPLIQKAKEMGYETHVFAWREGAVGAADD